jgi:hypothetical protein
MCNVASYSAVFVYISGTRQRDIRVMEEGKSGEIVEGGLFVCE